MPAGIFVCHEEYGLAMFGWLKRWIQIRGARAAQTDIERFVLGLRGMDAHEIAGIVVYATRLRIQFRSGEGMSAFLEESQTVARLLETFPPWPSADIPLGCLWLGNLIRSFQKSNRPDIACALMVWLHTLRSCVYPEIRIFARSMWAELSRGFDVVLDYVKDTPEGYEMASECHWIPPGLEPMHE